MRLRSTTFFMFLPTLITLAVAHHAAVYFSLYWVYPWFDSMMHFLGGLMVALGFLVLWNLHETKPFRVGMAWTLVVVFVVGAVWEVFEVFAGISIQEPMFVEDTITDFIFDLVGGAAGYLLARSLKGLDQKA